MTPTQQRLHDLRAACGDVWNRANMVEMVEHSHALSEAEVEAWKAGECCGDRRGERCVSRMVQLQRSLKLQAAGVRVMQANRIGELCEHCPAYAAACSGLLSMETDIGAAEAASVWGRQFIQFMEGIENGDGTIEERNDGEGEAARDRDEQRAVASE